VRKIRSETDTRVELPESGSDSDVVVITGKKENVRKAAEMLQQIQTEMADVVSVDIQIPRKIHNTMIGSGGKLIQSVMEDCGGVSIKFPPHESNSDKVSDFKMHEIAISAVRHAWFKIAKMVHFVVVNKHFLPTLSINMANLCQLIFLFALFEHVLAALICFIDMMNLYLPS